MAPIKEVLTDKRPPQSNEAEIAVLGSMLLDKEAIGQAIELL
ncbi:MAG: DnaB-like helicase N-terminal domain-containing protein, partial [Candidatus Omnitrophota bacterium]